MGLFNRLLKFILLATTTIQVAVVTFAADVRAADGVGLRRDYLGKAIRDGMSGGAHTDALVKEIEKAGDGKMSTKIFFGQPVPDGVFRETVAIRSGKRLCTGVLIASDAVLTAAHCVCDFGLRSSTSNARVFMTNISSAADLQGLLIKSAAMFDPNFCEKRKQFGDAKGGTDIALLRLVAGATPDATFSVVTTVEGHFSPARIVPTFAYLSSAVQGMIIVGFGLDENSNIGVKRFANVYIASRICGTRYARALFGCRAGTEMVLAGNYGQDTCRGDSGGPAFAVLGTDYYLAGITSRAIDGTGRCGPGGIYTFITPAFVNWIRIQGVTLNAQQ